MERRPLLDDVPSTYNTLDNGNCASDTSTLAEPENTEPPPLNNFSRLDTCWILAGLWSAVFLGALDGTVVATLLSPIGSHFNRLNQSSYIGTSYLLSVCCFTPLYGRLSDILGRKGAMLLALTLFGSGTIFCALAPTMESLIAARAVAGMGGGGVMTVSSIVVTDLIPLKQRGLYQGMANILFGLGAGIGGPVGGWINDAFGWQAAFLFQAPILLFSFVLVSLKVNIQLPSDVQNQSLKDKLRRIDFLGSLTLVGTVGCLLLGFSLKTTEEMAWSHPLIWGLFILSAIFAALFVAVEKFVSPYPVMPLRLITQRTPLAVSMSNLLGSMAAFSTLYNIPLYFTAVRLYSSANAGLHLLPHSVAISSGSVFAGWQVESLHKLYLAHILDTRMMRRTGKLYRLTLCSGLMCIAASVSIVFWNEHTSPFHLWIDIVPQGFGMASLITTTLIAMIAGVLKEDMAVATGITYLFRTTGQVLGVSISGAIFQAALLQKLRLRIQGPGSAEVCRFSHFYNVDTCRHSTNIISTLDPFQKAAAIKSYTDALQIVFICQAVWNFLAFLWCIPIQENVLP
ncbi:major facilitator superfamily domain-containing protein [Lentinula aff. detonsa]|uniref:Major facilitator superfamily domain-containing protein n=1 Tax=Lentinula aff. detonsa TaxID=2804958 RepID=A0AA38NSV7_9AGAR|nr:major facilitator superfamily domain-containing protein [Lentinula aff. detonsa]KAJ3803069.1 major facilitator superfamily domain-containing protein [Lentinula aff. detonsa]